MAFAFGDSYLKLPPISKEGTVELDGENSKRGSGIVRDKHGLVRLPPIVRLDSLRSASSASRLRSETQTTTEADSESDLSTLITPSKISHKMESLRHRNSTKFKKYTAKREDETKLIKDLAVKETNEDEARFFDGEEASHGKQKNRFRLGSNTPLDKSTDDEDLMPPYKESVMRRRGSSTFQTLGKLTRSHRLAKSSPELSNRKINLRRRPESTLSSLTAGLRSTSRSRLSQPRLSVHDIDGSTLSHLQDTSKTEEKQKEHEKQRRRNNHRWANDSANQPRSTPSSPVCSESVNKEIKQKGRKSLNDITDAMQFTDRRRPSLTPKKQNLIQESEALKIEGKSCVHNERERLPDHVPGTDGHVDTLHPPKQGEKRHSLYDLQQILTLLQEENLKRQTSSTASTPRNTSATSSANDKASNASVYDLREFLMLAAAEASNASTGQTKKKASASQHLLLPGQERENTRNERKGSVYDLMEFLSLGSVAESESSSASENSSRATSPRIVLSPGSPGSNDSLSVSTHAEEGRRSSTYDLMEFLSLSRSGGSSRSDSGQSTPALRGNDSSGVENEESELGRQKKENRSLSVYDLAEFLSMTSAVPPLVRVTPASDEEQTKASANLAQSSGAMNNHLNMPRQSVYDLREILNVLQQEHERKRESTYSLQEILSKMQREADEKSHLPSGNAGSNEKDTLASLSPPMTASSGYSTASDSATSASAKYLEANTSNRQMSVYDLKEFLSLHAIQQSQPNQQQLSSAVLRRKFSGVSQSGVSIYVTDESNRSIDSEVFEDVFLPVPGIGTDPSGPSPKRGSVYDLREFLNILNDDESPLRRRLSSVSSASSKPSESEPESNSYTNSRNSDSAAANENITAGATRPQLSPRQDSGGSMSLYDLGEFLSLLNTDESPLRRRLSSASEIMAGEGEIRVRTPVLSRSDSEKGFYSLEEILTLMKDLEQKRVSENTSGELEVGSGEEISLQVPTLPPKTDKINNQPLSSKKRLQSQRSLKSVPETSEVRSNISNSS